MGKISGAEVLRLRATRAVSRDKSVRRSAQDDGLWSCNEKQPKQVNAYGTPVLGPCDTGRKVRRDDLKGLR